VPVTTFAKINGPRPNKQKAANHAVRDTIYAPLCPPDIFKGSYRKGQQAGGNSPNSARLDCIT
jgi:hypothetical protein